MKITLSSLNDISRNVPLFKAHGHKVTPHWLIGLKVDFEFLSKRGYVLEYNDGYFFWTKHYNLNKTYGHVI